MIVPTLVPVTRSFPTRDALTLISVSSPPVIAEYVRRNPELSPAITGIFPHGGKLLVGFGDWAINGGTIPLVAFDPATGGQETLLEEVFTENLSIFREIDGALYAPYIDPRAEFRDGKSRCLLTNAGGTWENAGDKGMVHIFDVTSIGGQIFICGSDGSGDGGKAAIATPGDDVTPGVEVASDPMRDDFARFYRFHPSPVPGTVRFHNPVSGQGFLFDGDELTQIDWAPMQGIFCPLTDYCLTIAQGGNRWRVYDAQGRLLLDCRAPELPPVCVLFYQGKMYTGTAFGEIKIYEWKGGETL